MDWVVFLALALGCLLPACVVQKADTGGSEQTTTEPSGPAASATESGSSEGTGPSVPPSTGEATSMGETTGTTAEPLTTTADSQSSTSGGVQHMVCEVPFPEPAPPLPPINFGPDARPRFDDWTDLDCGSLTAVACGRPEDPPCNGICLRGTAEGPGVCTFADIDIWCDGEGEAIGYGEGTCWACSPSEARALACCEFPEGFDCRDWPYPSDGPPGSICARHEDCEPGLVCGAHRGEGYGICQCPGLVAEDVAPPQSCFQQ
ncbi:hypothetical protein OV079_46125 [Nannocystis pusilla]|uniref:Uncharacterized protein n=1 Tax=Nannocystis pusilla TaxID=889268 RepID=A0A9X3J3G2_9BACT|nr:hypothetical protein [Nannocystis pusilla]MCY1012794.1 hypothetical protein [Nannocystis pusilla]